MTVFLVRFGRTLQQPGVPTARWDLDPAGFDDVWALRDRLPQGAAWFTAPEPAAMSTAQLLTDADVGVLEDLRAQGEQEPSTACRARVHRTVAAVLGVHHDQDVVLVGHATAWTGLVADLTGVEPDPDRWATLAVPDVIELPHPIGSAT